MGRPRKPDAMHALEGTGRADRGHGTGVAFPPLAADDPPEWLGTIGKSKWTELVTAMQRVEGLLADLDRDAIAIYCADWESFLQLNDAINSMDSFELSRPLRRIKNQTLARLDKLRSQFGMTPAARAQLRLRSKTTDDEFAEFANMLRLRIAGDSD